jgi:hypothetical protein
MHTTQNKILKTLLLNKKARFSEMNLDNISNDHFSFHVKRLIELGHIIKDLPDLFGDVLLIIEMVDRQEFSFLEKKYKVDRY